MKTLAFIFLTITQKLGGRNEAVAFICLGMAIWLLNVGAFLPSFHQGIEDISKDIIIATKELHASGFYKSQILWTSLGLMGLWLLFAKKVQPKNLLPHAFPLIILMFICTASVLWANEPDVAFRRAVRLWFLTFLAAGIAVTMTSPRAILESLMVITGVIMSINFVTLFLFPEPAGLRGYFVGVHFSKNHAGYFAMLAFLTSYSYFQMSHKRERKYIALVGMVIWFLFLIGTGSKTAISTTIFTIFIIQIYIKMPKNLAIFTMITVFFLSIFVFFTLYFNITMNKIYAFLSSEQTFSTFVDRIKLWDWTLRIYWDNPLGGVGYGSFWGVGGLTPAEQYARGPLTPFLLNLNQAHNGYVDLLVMLGTLGAFGFVILLIKYLKLIIDTARCDGEQKNDLTIFSYYIFSVFVATLIINVNETSFLLADRVQWFMFIFGYLSLCRFKRESQLLWQRQT